MKPWNTKPMLRLRTVASSSLLICETFFPSRTYWPLVGRSRQPSTFMKVDLPEPDGPMMATNSPRSISTLTPSRARTSGASDPPAMR
ncbi:hypothetical protein D3C83_120640 [compost metagenome]